MGLIYRKNIMETSSLQYSVHKCFHLCLQVIVLFYKWIKYPVVYAEVLIMNIHTLTDPQEHNV